LVNKQFAGKYTEVQEESELLNYKEDDKKIPFFITATCKGADLVNIQYEQLMPLVLPYQNAENFRVILGDFVTTEDGTGIVHTSPTLVPMMRK
jgi:isoleucyl-tRNA synthetase